MKNVPRDRYQWIKLVLLFSNKHRHIFKVFFSINIQKISSNVFLCVGILQFLLYKLSKEDMK